MFSQKMLTKGQNVAENCCALFGFAVIYCYLLRVIGT